MCLSVSSALSPSFLNAFSYTYAQSDSPSPRCFCNDDLFKRYIILVSSPNTTATNATAVANCECADDGGSVLCGAGPTPIETAPGVNVEVVRIAHYQSKANIAPEFFFKVKLRNYRYLQDDATALAGNCRSDGRRNRSASASVTREMTPVSAPASSVLVSRKLCLHFALSRFGVTVVSMHTIHCIYQDLYA